MSYDESAPHSIESDDDFLQGIEERFGLPHGHESARSHWVRRFCLGLSALLSMPPFFLVTIDAVLQSWEGVWIMLSIVFLISIVTCIAGQLEIASYRFLGGDRGLNQRHDLAMNVVGEGEARVLLFEGKPSLMEWGLALAIGCALFTFGMAIHVDWVDAGRRSFWNLPFGAVGCAAFLGLTLTFRRPRAIVVVRKGIGLYSGRGCLFIPRSQLAWSWFEKGTCCCLIVAAGPVSVGLIMKTCDCKNVFHIRVGQSPGQSD